jgi:xylulose-5-phosphate/fructose-6-phosphate phosphoketolase
MPGKGEALMAPNPPPLASHLPDELLEIAAKVIKKPLEENVLESLKDFQNAACYIAAGEPFQPVPMRTAASGR